MSQQVIHLKDHNGKIIQSLTSPAAFFDSDSGTLLKLGEAADVLPLYNHHYETLKAYGFTTNADAIVYMNLPLDEELINKIFHCSGYIQRIYQQQLSTVRSETT